jgi:hypothetical protein
MRKKADPRKAAFAADEGEKQPEMPVSLRVSARMAARMTAAARELGLDRTDFMRYAIVRLIIATPYIIENMKESDAYPMALKLSGTGLKDTPVSLEELTYALQYRGELDSDRLGRIVERIEKLEARVKKE